MCQVWLCDWCLGRCTRSMMTGLSVWSGQDFVLHVSQTFSPPPLYHPPACPHTPTLLLSFLVWVHGIILSRCLVSSMNVFLRVTVQWAPWQYSSSARIKLLDESGVVIRPLGSHSLSGSNHSFQGPKRAGSRSPKSLKQAGNPVTNIEYLENWKKKILGVGNHVGNLPVPAELSSVAILRPCVPVTVVFTWLKRSFPAARSMLGCE